MIRYNPKPFLAALLLLTLLMALSGCSKPIELPEVPPLPAEAEALLQRPELTAKHPNLFDTGLQLTRLDGERIRFRLLSPEATGHYPVLLFSHGNWSHQLEYDALITHWAQQGYIVLSMDHRDCCGMARGIVAALRFGNVRLIEQRVQHLALLLNQPAPWLSLLPAGVKANLDQVAVTGHSFGAYSAQLFQGATFYDPAIKAQRPVDVQLSNPAAIRAVVAISPPGPMFDEITENSWDNLQGPVLVTTGSWDVEPRFFPDYRLHLMSHQKALPGSQYGLVLAGADHYFGRLIGRTGREEQAQQVQFQLLLLASTAFLDAYLKGDPKAQQFLQSDELTEITQGFASLSLR
ncbi:hypothetical protein QWY20_15920 [Alkalimonas sp. MEB108]|uniref:Platelet-activating factor acetylhydrolase plasma/intracellular n=1 Tax=Alkalimonas cellulosilytica TaxID=3058395 RepID=A0ABU7JAR2_9GAMM|nr:hypothetical protein [Alkalimonas sp. MEB108]MEE2002945.1 hypothetical protein [Alkalimonas sp. MEB108]